MSRKLSHTVLRGQTFYTNFRLNDSSKTVRLSLNTDSFTQARAIMSKVAPYIPLVQSGTMAVEEFKAKLNGMRNLTKHELDAFVFKLLESNFLEAQRIPKLAKIAKNLGLPLPSPEESTKAANEYVKVGLSWLYEGNEGTERILRQNFLDQKIAPTQLLAEISEAGNLLDLSQAKLYQAYKAFYAGNITEYEDLVSHLKPPIVPSQLNQEGITLSGKDNQKQSMKLSEAWDMFTKEKGKYWRKSTANENQRFYDVLFHTVGDTSIDLVTRQNIRRALHTAEMLPTRTKKPYSSMSLQECIEYDVPDNDLISSEHVNKHLKVWRSFFKTYLVDYKDLLTTSPTSGVIHKVNPNRGGNYDIREIIKIKEYLNSLPDQDWRKYYFLTLIYTGARRGEIAEIRKHHIREDEDTGRFYIFIEGGKSIHAKRKVPIHKLLECNLLKITQKLTDNDLVFNELPDYTSTTKEWVKIMRKLSILDDTEFGLKRRIHSLRHTFISKAIHSVNNETLVKFVVGHSHKKSLGVTDIYNHTPYFKDLLPVVDCQHE